jgi:hypothetical protein
MSFLPVNLQNVSAATGFDYPPGYYLMQVDRCEIRTNQDGQGQRLLVHNTIVMGPQHETKYQGRKLANSYQLTEKGAPFLKRMFLSCGITDDFIAQNGGNVDPDWLTGRQYVCQVVKNSGYTNITNERPTTDWETVVKQAGGNAAPTPQIQTPPAAAAPGAAAPQPSMLQPVAPPPMAAPGAVPGMAAPPMAPPQPTAAPPQPTAAPAAPAAPPAPAGIPAPPPPPGQIPGQGQ